MTVDPARSANTSRLASVCPHCGGSGTLRLGGQRYRTCLPCLGQGQTPSLTATITMAKLAALRAEALSNATQFDAGELSAAELSAAASAAAAR